MDLQKHLIELNEQMDVLRQEKESVEKSLRSEIKQLKEQVCVSGGLNFSTFSFFWFQLIAFALRTSLVTVPSWFPCHVLLSFQDCKSGSV